MKFDFKKLNMKDLLAKVKSKKGGEAESDKTNSKLFDKVGDFFNYEPQKERVLRHEDFRGAGDPYYASVSAGFKVTERLLWLVLAIFMVFSLITNYKEITYNNVFYLFRDFSSIAEQQSSSYQVLSYDSDERQKFELFRGGIVSASPSYISVFTSGGRRTLKNNTDYDAPNVICCDKYVLVYDTAGSSFSVYNSFAKIHNQKLESPITDADFDDDGSFALATRKNDAETVIYIYNGDIKPIAECRDDRYVFDMSLDSKKEKLIALYYEAGSGIGRTVICEYDISRSGNDEKEIVLDGEFPIECAYLSNGSIAIITNRSIHIYDDRLREEESVSFADSEITAFDACRDGAAVAVSSGTQKKVIAFDKKGDLIYNNITHENVRDIGVIEKTLFLHGASGVTRIDTKKDKSEFLSSEHGKMLVYDEFTVIVCGNAKAEYIVFDK